MSNPNFFVGSCIGAAIFCLGFYNQKEVVRRKSIKNERKKEDVDGDRACRICFDSDKLLISPCRCKGSVGHVHYNCLKKWRLMAPKVEGANKCEICKYPYQFYRPKWIRVMARLVSFVGSASMLASMFAIRSQIAKTFFNVQPPTDWFGFFILGCPNTGFAEFAYCFGALPTIRDIFWDWFFGDVFLLLFSFEMSVNSHCYQIYTYWKSLTEISGGVGSLSLWPMIERIAKLACRELGPTPTLGALFWNNLHFLHKCSAAFNIFGLFMKLQSMTIRMHLVLQCFGEELDFLA